MKILHTSDWHLGRILHEQNLAADQKHFLDQFIAHISAVPYDAVVVAGDVFDRSIPNEEAIDLWNGFLQAFVGVCPDTPLVVIAGNHDSAARLSTAASIIERVGIHIRGGAERITEPVAITDRAGSRADIWCIPFLYPGALSEKTDEGERILHSQSDVLAEALNRIRSVMDSTHINIAVSHCFAAGAELSDSERTLVGTAVQVSAGLFKGFDYVALGHIHRSQKLDDRIRYSGTPMPYSFSEADQPKGVLSVVLSKSEDPKIVHIPIEPLRPMHNISGAYKTILTDSSYDVWKDAYVRICLSEPNDSTMHMNELRARFPYLLEFRDYVSAGKGSGVDSVEDDLDETDIFDDFIAFEQRLYGDDAATEKLVEAFRTIQEAVERGAAR